VNTFKEKNPINKELFLLEKKERKSKVHKKIDIALITHLFDIDNH